MKISDPAAVNKIILAITAYTTKKSPDVSKYCCIMIPIKLGLDFQSRIRN